MCPNNLIDFGVLVLYCVTPIYSKTCQLTLIAFISVDFQFYLNYILFSLNSVIHVYTTIRAKHDDRVDIKRAA